ncbi:MAG TPA: substrate-binding domain-containing protein [Armatimonadota bacterium]|nr:substrate-binding domain-containing protein [Armatimonadota bacterium]
MRALRLGPPCALALLALMLAAGCVRKADQTGPASGPAGAVKSEAPGPAAAEVGEVPLVPENEARYTVGVSLLTSAHVFYQTLERAMREEALKHKIRLKIQSAEFKAAQQRHQIEDFITSKVDAIVVCPVESANTAAIIGKANTANIPVFTADIRADQGDVVCHVATDNVEGGRLAGERMAELLKGKGEVIIIDHPQVASVQDRTRGFVEALAKHPGIKVVARPVGAGVRETARKAMEDALIAHPEMDGVFCINDSTAMGALAALQSQVKPPNIVMVSYDGDPEACEEIRRGTALKADVVQYPAKIGSQVIQAIADHLSGKPVPKEMPVKPGIVDAESLAATHGKPAE